jgi:hypothetical protein
VAVAMTRAILRYMGAPRYQWVVDMSLMLECRGEMTVRRR